MFNSLSKDESGFSLLELLTSTVVIGILSLLSVISYQSYAQQAKISVTAQELNSFVKAFTAYMAENGDFPPDSHAQLPSGMNKYISQAVWDEPTPIGGHYNWEGRDSYPYAGISIFDTTASSEQLQILDRMLDDGVLTDGRFRIGVNGRPTFIIEE